MNQDNDDGVRLRTAEVWTVINALRLAGDAYAEDAGNFRGDEDVLAEQFDRQAVEVRELADRLEGDA